MGNAMLPTPVLPAMRLVQEPRSTRRLAIAMLVALACLPVALLFVPWQQTVVGTGKVIAYLPSDRPQIVEAPIEGRVQTWHVWEGKSVKKGESLVDIQDNDPELVKRLQEQVRVAQDREKAAMGRVERFTAQVGTMEKARMQAIEAARQRLISARNDVSAAENGMKRVEATLEFDRTNYEMQQGLFNLGLTSGIDFQRAKRAFEANMASVDQARDNLNKAKAQEKAAEADVDRVTNSEAAAIETARANLESARAEQAAAQASIIDLQVRVSRQGTQHVTAPVSGTVQRLITRAGSGGEIVRPGDPLLEIVPDTSQRDDPDRAHPVLVVELFIDGLDTPLLLPQTGQHVRLQFEGYPAIQFSGFPAAMVGTFGGRVLQVDPSDNGKGQFRILVEPEPHPMYEGEDVWPKGNLLRQGMRANGWVFLNQVSLGWELWRRLNGFPPVVPTADSDKEPKVKRKPPK